MKVLAFYKFIAFIFVAILVIQLLFSCYTKFLAFDMSVLDQYADDVDALFYQNMPLDTLAKEYNKAKQELKRIDAQADSLRYTDKFPAKVYDSLSVRQTKLREAIENREEAHAQPRKTLFYCIAGLFLAFIGMIAYRKLSRSLGIISCLLGFSLVIWWSSPTHRLMSERSITAQQRQELLTLEIVLSLITLLVLVSMWILFERSEKNSLEALEKPSLEVSEK